MGEETPYFVSVEEALAIANKTPLRTHKETVELGRTLNRILATDIRSPIDDPPFDNSAMDGWAVKHSDTISATETTPAWLTITDTIQAGSKQSQPSVVSGQAARIMTGAPMPPGADAIVQVELSKVDEESNKVGILAEAKQNYIRYRGENISVNQTIFPRGTLLTPSRIGLCATMGFPELEVQTKIKIAIISTGDEIVPVGEELGEGQIYESNSHGLAALVEWLGHTPILFPNVADSMPSLRTALDEAAKQADIIITSGGVSMGEFDLVRKIMEEEGTIHFWRVKLRPGSPPLFGTWNSIPIWGLPGNPVSSHVVFRILVAPWIRQQTDASGPREERVRVKLADSVKVMKDGLTLRRVQIKLTEEGLAGHITTHQGSGNLHSLATSSALTLIPPGASGDAGGWIDALLL